MWLRLREAFWLLLLLSAHPALAQDIWLPGYTRPLFDLNLSLPVTGRIEELLVREGDRVEPAARLLAVDSNLEAMELRRRRAILESRAELAGALARQPLILAQLRAARTMHANGVAISREDLQARELAAIVVATEIEVRRAQKQMELVDYEIAGEVLERRSLRAPIAGRIARIMRFPGESVLANEPIIRLVAVDRLLFVGALEARVAARFRLGASASVRVDDVSGEVEVLGTVTLVGPVADPASGLVEVRVEFANSNESLRAGVPARLRLVE
ncbi:efflux RND transporter periplasmic adaptor subunit [Falsiroseomonas sp.]|uniref:efflux RND transporter periplasmic adaptor subunit n=1 Tax=Falsiroseomonas sp. TaxID=2870721 RepID=UPI003F6E5723